MDKNIVVSITAGTVIRTVAILALVWMLFILQNLVLVIIASVVIASAIEPGVVAIMKRHVPRLLAVTLIYFSIFLVFFVFFYFFLPSVLTDLSAFIASMPNYLESIKNSGVFDQYASFLGIPAPSAISATDIMSSIRGIFHMDSTYTNALGAAGQVFGGFFSFFLVIVFSFYFSVIETGIDDFLQIIIPKKNQRYALNLWKRSQLKIGLWMQGQLLLAFIMGILVYLGLMILGVPHALVLAMMASLFEIVPVFGPILAAVPAVVLAFTTGGTSLGLVVIGFYVVAQQFETHLIYPLVVRRIVGVPPLLVILGLIVGGELFGIFGILLAVPFVSIIQELAHDLETGAWYAHAE